MRSDIIQDASTGWFYRDNGDGSLDSLSGIGGAVPATASKSTMAGLGKPVVIVRDGQSTGAGDPMASRVAVVMARRYS